MLVKEFNANALKNKARMEEVLEIASKSASNKKDFIYVGEVFGEENILRDLRDFIFEPIPQLDLLKELDKRGIAFMMRPFSLWFSIYWDENECKGVNAEGCLTNKTFRSWIDKDSFSSCVRCWY